MKFVREFLQNAVIGGVLVVLPIPLGIRLEGPGGSDDEGKR